LILRDILTKTIFSLRLTVLEQW